jgi:prevent-host-death family protein
VKAVKTIRVRDLRNDYAQIIREIEAGETFTVTSDGRPVASLTPYVEPDGPQTWVPATRAVGGLAHLNLPEAFAESLRRDLDENFVMEVMEAEDPLDRWESQSREQEPRDR